MHIKNNTEQAQIDLHCIVKFALKFTSQLLVIQGNLVWELILKDYNYQKLLMATSVYSNSQGLDSNFNNIIIKGCKSHQLNKMLHTIPPLFWVWSGWTWLFFLQVKTESEIYQLRGTQSLFTKESLFIKIKGLLQCIGSWYMYILSWIM